MDFWDGRTLQELGNYLIFPPLNFYVFTCSVPLIPFYNKMVCVLNPSLCLLLNNFASWISNLLLIPQIIPWFSAQTFQIRYLHPSCSVGMILQSYSWSRGLQAWLWLLAVWSLYPRMHINVIYFPWVTWCDLVGKHKSLHAILTLWHPIVVPYVSERFYLSTPPCAQDTFFPMLFYLVAFS